jgi:hypothetical protein
VLLANGNLVKEGLDLVELPTLVETGIEYRINDLRQRDRRSRRWLGTFAAEGDQCLSGILIATNVSPHEGEEYARRNYQGAHIVPPGWFSVWLGHSVKGGEDIIAGIGSVCVSPTFVLPRPQTSHFDQLE